ncbi:helix-turn-helix domain-containing protein [Streptomyces sp. NPDC058304]|uniref:helix-turn-helix domain-containing protein n=1 Tax=Streptomyces sp. NPDC058304 TaxID=3346437 RepID=UPI0036E4C388
MCDVRHRVCVQGDCDRFFARPDSRLQPGIGRYRAFRLTRGVPQQRLFVPSGQVSLFIMLDGEMRAGRAGQESAAASTCTAAVYGPHIHPKVLGHAGSMEGVEICVLPWAAYTLFGVSMGDLADTMVDACTVLGPRILYLAEALSEAPGWPDRFTILDQTLLRWTARAAASREPAPPVLRAWDLLTRTAGTIPIRELAASIDWSQRQLEIRFRDQIGLSPKRLARVLRLNQSILMLSKDSSQTEAAITCGFYDQAHLTREFKALTGMPPGRFLAALAPSCSWPTN